MAHSGGFEPPTARFVAEYSIQLSYECVVEARILLIRSFIVKHLFLNFLIYLEINAFKINEIHKSFNLNT
jgi:hypothetical protein